MCVCVIKECYQTSILNLSLSLSFSSSQSHTKSPPTSLKSLAGEEGFYNQQEIEKTPPRIPRSPSQIIRSMSPIKRSPPNVQRSPPRLNRSPSQQIVRSSPYKKSSPTSHRQSPILECIGGPTVRIQEGVVRESDGEVEREREKAKDCTRLRSRLNIHQKDDIIEELIFKRLWRNRRRQLLSMKKGEEKSENECHHIMNFVLSN